MRGATYEILKRIEDALMAREGKWNLRGANFTMLISELVGKEGEKKRITMVAINKFGASICVEFLCDVTWVANRTHQLANGDTKCHRSPCPHEGEGNEMSQKKAKSLLMGRFLAKAARSLAQRGAVVTQEVASSNARNLTDNNEQKGVLSGRGGG